MVKTQVNFHPHLPPGCVIFIILSIYTQQQLSLTAISNVPCKRSYRLQMSGKPAHDGVVLCYHNKMNLPMLYVALSRVQTLDKLFIHGQIPYSAFQTKWPEDLKLEMLRL
jgi:hypothetical protein